jgi:hypothetical protein
MIICLLIKKAFEKVSAIQSHRQQNLFAEQVTLDKIREIGHPLEINTHIVQFEMFRKLLEAKLLNNNKEKNASH